MLDTFSDWLKHKPPPGARFISGEYKTWDNIVTAIEEGELDCEQAAEITKVPAFKVIEIYEHYRKNLMSGDSK